MDIGKRIMSLREEKGWSQRELARRVNLNPSVMNRIELSERPIKDQELAKIADVLDVTTDYLLGRTDNPASLKPNSESSLEYYKKKITAEFPDIDLMFKDMESLTAEDMKEVYDYIKFKMSQKKE